MFPRTLRLKVIVLLITGVASIAHGSDLTFAEAPPRRAPHDNAKKLADNLALAASKVLAQLDALPPAVTPSEKRIKQDVASFAAEADKLRHHLTRYLVDKTPTIQSLERLNKMAWKVRESLEKTPKYKAVWSTWARTIVILRQLQRVLPRR